MNAAPISLAPPLRVLVVEDNAINLELVTDVLEGDGYTVLTATNGDDGLRMVQTELPDLVLMDVQLPGIDGLEVTRRLKSDPATSMIRIIALTAHAMLGDDESMAAAGCDGYISKPIRLGPFREVVASHLRRTQSDRNRSDPLWQATAQSNERNEPSPGRPGREEEGRIDTC